MGRACRTDGRPESLTPMFSYGSVVAKAIHVDYANEESKKTASHVSNVLIPSQVPELSSWKHSSGCLTDVGKQ